MIVSELQIAHSWHGSEALGQSPNPPPTSSEHGIASDTTRSGVHHRLHLEQIYATAPIGLAVLDRDLHFLRINERLAEINGLSVEAHIGRSIGEILPNLAAGAEAIRDRFVKGESPINGVFAGITPANPEVLCHWQAHWSPIRDPDGRLIALNVAVEDVTALKSQEEREKLLSGELKHRLNNVLAVVQAVANSTFEGSAKSDQLNMFRGRLMAFAAANQTLANEAWHRAEVGEIVRHVSASLPVERITCEGQECFVGSEKAMNLSLALHELGTNAMKYGSLSGNEGSVHIRWACSDGEVKLTWRESGGPPVQPPTRKGFGSTLIERLVPQAERALEYRPEGVFCTIKLPAADAGYSSGKEEADRKGPTSRLA